MKNPLLRCSFLSKFFGHLFYCKYNCEWHFYFTMQYMLWPGVCLSQSGVLLKQLNGWNRFSVQNQSKRTSLCNLVPDSELSRFLCFFCHGTSTITGVVNLVRPSRSHLLSFAHWSLAVGSINCNFLRCCCWVVCEHWLYQLMAWCDMSAAIFIFIMKLVNEVCIEVNDKD